VSVGAASAHPRGRGVREMVILHEWSAVGDASAVHAYGRFSVCSAEYGLDYDDEAEASVAAPRWGWAVFVAVGCVAVLMSPLAVCLAGALCVLVLVVREVGRWVLLRRCVLVCRRRTGRHRASRRGAVGRVRTVVTGERPYIRTMRSTVSPRRISRSSPLTWVVSYTRSP
jgi:hypothetical protein